MKHVITSLNNQIQSIPLCLAAPFPFRKIIISHHHIAQTEDCQMSSRPETCLLLTLYNITQPTSPCLLYWWTALFSFNLPSISYYCYHDANRQLDFWFSDFVFFLLLLLFHYFLSLSACVSVCLSSLNVCLVYVCVGCVYAPLLLLPSSS